MTDEIQRLKAEMQTAWDAWDAAVRADRAAPTTTPPAPRKPIRMTDEIQKLKSAADAAWRVALDAYNATLTDYAVVPAGDPYAAYDARARYYFTLARYYDARAAYYAALAAQERETDQ
jgi:hypothetical protein